MLFAVDLLLATTKKTTSSISPILILVYVVVFGFPLFLLHSPPFPEAEGRPNRREPQGRTG